ncbi:MAG: elongation factor G [Acidobacteriota bacterium]|nr:elongation factor G [Acidobacteriota bacterium]
MKVYDAAAIRNVALVGHSGSGKTQLTSALLFDSGAVNRFGKVDDGTTVTDSDDEEIARKHTLSAGLAATEWNKHKINIIDTPGMGNFLSDARASLRVVEAAIIVVDAVSGVEVSTEKLWAAAEELEVPRIIVLNRLDRDRASVERALESVRERLGRGAVAVQMPIGEEKHFHGVVDLISMKSYSFEAGGSGRMTEGGMPGALVDAARVARESLIEMIAEADDALMEKFFEAGTLTQEELLEGLHRGVRAGKVYPVLCTSGLHNIGVQPLLDAIVHFVPAPTEHLMRGMRPGSEESIEKEADPSGPAVAYVWKTIADQFAGRITLFRVVTGTIKSDSAVHNVTRDVQERLGHVLLVQGKTHTHVAEIRAGDLGAVAKLKDTQTGDTIGDAKGGIVMRPMTFAEPVISYAMEPKTRGDEDKISTAMHRLQEEDPSIGYSRDPQTHELLLSGQGQLHIEVTVAKLKRRFGVEVNLKLPRIPYRETITASTEAHGRHKKQTGGHGQFGDCRIRVAPLPRGADFEFEDDIFGGSIPRQFVPAIEKGIQDTRMRGFLAGYPMVDFKVTVYDGSYHDVDSNEMSFRMAGRLAFRDAMTRCRPTILEPVMRVEVVSPSEFAGDLMGDLNGRRGRISGMDTRGSSTIIKAQVPMAEMLTYEQQLTSMTGGRGGYHMEFSHYDEVPQHQQTTIIEKSKAERAGIVEEEP